MHGNVATFYPCFTKRRGFWFWFLIGQGECLGTTRYDMAACDQPLALELATLVTCFLETVELEQSRNKASRSRKSLHFPVKVGCDRE